MIPSQPPRVQRGHLTWRPPSDAFLGLSSTPGPRARSPSCRNTVLCSHVNEQCVSPSSPSFSHWVDYAINTVTVTQSIGKPSLRSTMSSCTLAANAKDQCAQSKSASVYIFSRSRSVTNEKFMHHVKSCTHHRSTGVLQLAIFIHKYLSHFLFSYPPLSKRTTGVLNADSFPLNAQNSLTEI